MDANTREAIQFQMQVDQIRAANRRGDSAKIIGDALRELIDMPDDAEISGKHLKNYIMSLSQNFLDHGIYLLYMRDWDWSQLAPKGSEDNEWRWF